jgi:hypothetical protein
MKWHSATLAATLLAANVAHAEPCQTDPMLTRQIVVEHPMMVSFCEPCGDRVPGEPQHYSGGAFEPAYTYVQTSSGRYDNVAVLSGCPAAGVSPSLRVEEAADGVLIVPDPSMPLPPAPPHVIVVQEPVPTGLGWSAIALGCGLTSALWVAVVRWRRRRAHRPRLV